MTGVHDRPNRPRQAKLGRPGAGRALPLACLPLVLTMALPGSSLAQGVADARVAPLEEGIVLFRGKRVYDRACATCHGISGDGNGPSARYLDPRPRDFTSGIYKFRSTPTGQMPTTEDLNDTVTSGIPRTFMPAWKDLLTEQERRDVVAYMKTFSARFERGAASVPIVIPAEPNVTPATIAEGKSMYILMQCWACHGVRGRGDGPSADTLTDDWSYTIKAFDFTVGNFKGGNDNASVYKTFNTGLNGTPMPSFADTFRFGGDAIDDFSVYDGAYPAGEVADLRRYLETQPTTADLEALSEDQLDALASRRKWSLVHFVKSLSREPGLLYRLFVEDTEVTR